MAGLHHLSPHPPSTSLGTLKSLSPTYYMPYYILLLLFFLLSACSLQYVDKNGSRHIWGVTHTVIKEVRKERSEVVAQQVSTIGVSVLRLPEHSGLSLGYTKNFSINISSKLEGGVLAFSPENPTDARYDDLITLLGGSKDVQTDIGRSR